MSPDAPSIANQGGEIMRRLLQSVLASILLGTATPTAQLPPDIQLDRHIVRAERLLAEDNAAAAQSALGDAMALADEHDELVLPSAFHYYFARVALDLGMHEAAVASLNEYLLAAGRDGHFYRNALRLLDEAEEARRRADAERRAAERRADAERQRAERWPQGRVFRDCDDCPEMVVLPGSRLAMGRYEVTVGEYRAFASATGGGEDGCSTSFRDSWRDPGFLLQTDRHPVTCVNWNDAQEYVSWLSRRTGAAYRMPTEAEWERAAAGSQVECPYDRRMANLGTCPVGLYGSNAAGLSNMVGNLAEWTSDCYDSNCYERMVRGGSWIGNVNAQSVDARGWQRATYRDPTFGFRVSRTLD